MTFSDIKQASKIHNEYFLGVTGLSPVLEANVTATLERPNDSNETAPPILLSVRDNGAGRFFYFHLSAPYSANRMDTSRLTFVIRLNLKTLVPP